MVTGTLSSNRPARWDVIITEWALGSYLDLKHQRVFDAQEYRTRLRPAVELLRDGLPSPHAQFKNSSFWGPAALNKQPLSGGFKMKWHKVGHGQVQLRLPVAVESHEALLCEAYVKSNPAYEQRMLARFKTHMNLISKGHYTIRGKL